MTDRLPAATSPHGPRGPASTMNPARRHRALRWVAWAGVGIVLALVFASWLRPDMMFSVLTQAWNCL